MNADTRSRGSSGTTLLEILVAMTILGILIAAIFSAFAFGQRVTTASGGRLVTLGYVQQEAESLRSAVGTTTLSAGEHVVPLPVNNPLTQFNPTRKYIVRNGKFKADGTITWSPNATTHQVMNDEQGNAINDTNYDLKEVKVRGEGTPPK